MGCLSESCQTCGGEGFEWCEEWDCWEPDCDDDSHTCPNCHGTGNAADQRGSILSTGICLGCDQYHSGKLVHAGDCAYVRALKLVKEAKEEAP